MAHIAHWIEVTRPKTLLAALSTCIFGHALCDHLHSIPLMICIFLCACTIQIVTNIANDYYDFIKGTDTALRVGPRRLAQSGLIQASHLLYASFLGSCCILLLSVPLILRGGLPILSLTILSIVLAYGYTAGPYALSYLGLGDAAVLMGFGPLSVGAITYLHTLKCPMNGAFWGLIPGSLAMSILIINNLRDQHTDAQAGKQTLVVRFGTFFGKGECYASLLFSLCLTFYAAWTTPHTALLYTMTPAAIGIGYLMYSVHRATESTDYLPLLGHAALVCFIYSISFACGWLL